MKNYYKHGSWNILCAVCGVQFKSDEIRKRWDGLLVCKNDYEDRNILDFTRVKPEMGSVPYSNPEPAVDTFVDVHYLVTSIAGLAIAGFTAGTL
jgi:hypothetical protein